MDIYREQIIDLYKNPHNFREIPGVVGHRVFNPLCGDDITMYVQVQKNIVGNVGFKGRACAICTASASLVTDFAKGKNVAEVLKMNKETVLELMGISLTPVRLKCALLPLEALHKSLGGKNVKNSRSSC